MTQENPLKAKVRDALTEGNLKKLKAVFKENDVADIAEILAETESPSSWELFNLIPRSRKVGVFSFLEIDKQIELIEALPEAVLSRLLNEMEPDNRTRLLEELPKDMHQHILHLLSPSELAVTKTLLSYPEDSVGRLMTPDFLALKQSMKVSQALEYIHWSQTLPVEHLNYFFVTGDDSKLIGEVSLASLVVCDPATKPLSEIMKKNYVFLHPEQEQNDAVEIFRKYDHSYIPVIDDHKVLLGIVTADDVFDVAEDEATEDIHQFGGQGALEEGYFQTPVWVLFQKRIGWLTVLLIGGFISGEALKYFESEIERWTFLSLCLPAILSAGGNSGTQAAALIIRGFGIAEISLGDYLRVLRKESLVSLILGICMALFCYARMVFWGFGQEVALTISLSVWLVVIVGVIFGSMLPFLFQALKLDPAVASSPFISTLVDVSGVLILFSVAKYFLIQFQVVG